MDNSKIIDMNDIQPVVGFANYMSPTRGQGWPHHSIPDLELILIVNGEFTAQDPDHAHTVLVAGDVLLIRANHPCDLFCTADNSVFSCIHHELTPGKSYKAGDYTTSFQLPWVVHAKHDFVLVELFRQVAAEHTIYHHNSSEMKATLVKAIWLRLDRHMQRHTAEAKHRRLELMLTYLKDHCQEPISRMELAQHFEMTPEYINFLFKRELGISPGQVLLKMRLDLACDLLSQGRCSVAEIADQVGFNDALYFSRVFRREMGVPPSKYVWRSNSSVV